MRFHRERLLAQHQFFGSHCAQRPLGMVRGRQANAGQVDVAGLDQFAVRGGNLQDVVALHELSHPRRIERGDCDNLDAPVAAGGLNHRMQRYSRGSEQSIANRLLASSYGSDVR